MFTSPLQDTLTALKNVSELAVENNLTTRRNLRANIEKQSLQINEQFIGAFQEAFTHLTVLTDQVHFIDQTCQKMMDKIEELKLQTSDFLQQTSQVNSELKKLATNERVLNEFIGEYQLDPVELSMITTVASQQHQHQQLVIDDRFFTALGKIQAIHEKAKTTLANNQHITGFDDFQIPFRNISLTLSPFFYSFEIMDLMSKYEELANEKLYRWAIGVLRTITAANLDTVLELHSNSLFRALASLQTKEVLFKHCMDEYTTVRRSAVSHAFIEALTRGRSSGSTSGSSSTSSAHHYPAMERYSADIRRYVSDMLSFIYQTVVLERETLSTLLKLCDQNRLTSEGTLQTVLSAITEGLTRPLKIRVENSLISGNTSGGSGSNSKTTSNLKHPGDGTTKASHEKTKSYFLVKSILAYHLQAFSREPALLAEDAALVRLLRELLLLADKVFYNALNYYCSANVMERLHTSETDAANQGGGGGHQAIGEYLALIADLLEIIKSSSSSSTLLLDEQQHRLETERILTATTGPYLKHVIIYASKLASSLESTVLGLDCALRLAQTIGRYRFTEDTAASLSRQIDEQTEVLVNEQCQALLSGLAAASLYNAAVQLRQQAGDQQNSAVAASSFSGCDPLAVVSFLKNLDKFVASSSAERKALILPVINEGIHDASTR